MRNILIIILVILAVILICTVLPWLILFLGYWTSESPAKPEITYGEFPFKLVYEINGEEITVDDTLICNYDGIGVSEAVGKVRVWTSSLKSGNEKLVLSSYGNITLYYDIGSASYYMDDYNNGEFSPNVRCETKNEDGTKSDKLIFSDELLNKYAIVIKNWNIRPPIQNSFVVMEEMREKRKKDKFFRCSYSDIKY